MTAKELNAIAAKLAEQVANIRRKRADVVPPGWFTAQQIKKTIGGDLGMIRINLKHVGAEKKKFRILCGKRIQHIPHYRLK